MRTVWFLSAERRGTKNNVFRMVGIIESERVEEGGTAPDLSKVELEDKV